MATSDENCLVEKLIWGIPVNNGISSMNIFYFNSNEKSKRQTFVLHVKLYFGKREIVDK